MTEGDGRSPRESPYPSIIGRRMRDRATIETPNEDVQTVCQWAKVERHTLDIL